MFLGCDCCLEKRTNFCVAFTLTCWFSKSAGRRFVEFKFVLDVWDLFFTERCISIIFT